MSEQWWLENQIVIRLSFFLVALIILGTLESLYTWRPWLVSRQKRWLKHVSLMALSQLCIKLVFPMLAVGIALVVEERRMGILPKAPIPFELKILLGILALDFAIYWQHRIMHKYQWLWRFHKVHHMDRQIDVTTGIRFHPVEMLIVMGVKALAIAFFGVTAIAVLIFEIWLNLAALFTHVNIRMKPKTEKVLRSIIVTPSMHRIHHSDTPFETNSNYGFCLSIWDRVFKSYTRRSKTGEYKLIFGLEEYRSAKYQTLENMLLVPFNVKSLRLKRNKSPKLQFKNNQDILQRFSK